MSEANERPPREPTASDAMYAIYRRMDDLLAWLRDKHPEVFDDQNHLEEDSVESVYWHYGYAIALRDAHIQMRNFIDDNENAVRVAREAAGEE